MRGDAGTAFIDTLVAAAVVSLALGTMYEAIADSVHRDRVIEDRRTALMIARSELAAVGSELPIAAGTTRGVQGAFAWRVQMSPQTDDATTTSSAGILWSVTVSVGRTAGPALVTLRTLRLGPQA